MNRQEAVERLGELVRKSLGLAYGDDGGRDHVKRQAEMLLRRLFGQDTEYVSDLDEIQFYSAYGDTAADWRRGSQQMANLLSTAMDELELFGGEPAAFGQGQVVERKVFVVHGHDEALKQTVARVLEQLDLEPIILHDQPNKGRTIIEKFEDYSGVSFAVVLLTPDDMAYTRDTDSASALPRARQNVILELGFFLGRLGRASVAALYKGNGRLELPTDYSGVVFIPADDAGNWRFDLVRELRASGIEVDANRIVGS